MSSASWVGADGTLAPKDAESVRSALKDRSKPLRARHCNPDSPMWEPRGLEMDLNGVLHPARALAARSFDPEEIPPDPDDIVRMQRVARRLRAYAAGLRLQPTPQALEAVAGEFDV